MDSTVLAALSGAAVSGLVAALVAYLGQRSAAQLLREERTARTDELEAERAEWYRRSVYERRLGAAQEAYAWMARLNTAINRAQPGDVGSERTKALVQLCDEMREWYDSNCLWFHDQLPNASSLIGLINHARAYAFRGPDDPPIDVWGAFHEADSHVKDRANELLASRLR